MIDKGICDKGSIWNPSNCECACDKLVEEWSEIIEEVKITKITSMHSAECDSVKNECKSSCTIYVGLITIICTICIGIGTYFIYYKYMNHDKTLLLNMIMCIKYQIINITGKYQRNKHQKSNLLFFGWYDQL